MRTRHYSLKNPFADPSPELEAPMEDFPPPDLQPRRIYTVTELTAQIQGLLEQAFAAVWVQGEVSQPTISAKGHMYFSLKDSQALIKCVVWRDARERVRFNLDHGLQVICLGRISVYPQRGDYQLYVEQIEPKGIGALQLAFEQMKQRMEKEGLFDEQRKRPLPAFPERVGIVTSPTGAAIQDILKILQGNVQVLLRPVRVQGNGSAEALVQAIQDLNRFDDLDLLIVGRGGGSLEDLWAFNEETVARAIASSRIPIISAVGHERDFTIADFVADLRAPTPTKAAELVLAQRRAALDRLLAILEDPAFSKPEEWIKELEEQIQEKEQALLEGLEHPLLSAVHRLKILQGELMACSPQAVILHQAERLHRLQRALETGIVHRIDQLTAQVHGLAGRLNALSPLAVLERGYSITFDSQGKILKEAGAVQPGDLIQTRLHRGKLSSRVEEIQKGSDPAALTTVSPSGSDPIRR